MQVLALELDNYSLALQPAARQDGEVVWVPADAFARAVAAECKEVDGQWAMCRGDLCILLAASEVQVLHEVRFVRIDACAAPLDLRWSVEGGVLSVLQGRQDESRLGIGQVPPVFELPDLFSGALVSSASFRGRKTFFYMWASW